MVYNKYAMDSNTLHLHKTHKNSLESMVFLIIPVLLFTLVIAYFLSVNKPQSLSQTQDQTSVLGEVDQKP
jgi:hypothetical protein